MLPAKWLCIMEGENKAKYN